MVHWNYRPKLAS